ncbi:response regulator transcription factor, partial [Mesorhizobium sp. 128a]
SKALAEILSNVAAGESYVSPTLSAGDPLQGLTERETDILSLVAEGLSNKEVAARLSLQEKTVKHHMTRVLAKLNVRNRTEAALLMRGAAERGSQPCAFKVKAPLSRPQIDNRHLPTASAEHRDGSHRFAAR